MLVASGIALIAFAYLLGGWNVERRTGAKSMGSVHEDPVEIFWAQFLGNDHSPVIAYPDAVFLLDDDNDLFLFDHGAIDGRGAKVDPHVANEVASASGALSQEGNCTTRMDTPEPENSSRSAC
ncbi:hypothetical protein ACFQBQ_07955 [Granulicella cerasi]|uniref:MBL fold metallo-hydrolase n=1 Tax=Granulicella cerasi TaxID=741063 RepID=A0ABW1Z7G3_9BACT